MLAAKLLLLVLIANGAPVLAARWTPPRFGWPLDGGRLARDGFPLLGRSKTWRGLTASLAGTCLVAILLGLPAAVGLAIALAAVSGDLLSSFIKRRVGIASSHDCVGLDQIPESLLPLLAARLWFDLGWVEITLVVAAFLVLDLVLPRLLPMRRR